MYCKGTIPDIKDKIAGKAYSEILVMAASDTLTQQIRSQFATAMLPYRKEPNMFAPQIWRIKL
jgi:hypothetical protein